ncbi:hypothetical protein [Streptomyces sp. NPDC001665]
MPVDVGEGLLTAYEAVAVRGVGGGDERGLVGAGLETSRAAVRPLRAAGNPA